MAEQLTSTFDLAEWAGRVADWTQVHLLSLAALVQLCVALAAFGLAWIILRSRSACRAPEGEPQGWRADPLVQILLCELRRGARPGLAGLLLLLAEAAAKSAHLPHQVLSIFVSLALAWVVAHLAGALIKSRFLGRLAGAIVWVLAVLHSLNLFGPALELLDDLGFAVGSARISLLVLLKGSALLFVLLQAARVASGVVEHNLRKADGLSPSAQVLFSKGARFSLFALAVAITLSGVGVDLTSLTVFSGAVGVGVGFGLQKIFSNLVSGVILLLDKSLKPGDVIEMGGVQGKIAQINARYAAVETLDGKAYLIPNESLIGNEVINLSYSNSRLRLSAEVGVAYGPDPRPAMRLMEAAAAGTPRVLPAPPPRAGLKNFGDSAITLSVTFWIEDPDQGITNVRGDVLLAIWDAFHAHGVEIPCPQREVRILGAGRQGGI